MADIKISELTSAAALDGTEELPIVQNGATVKATAQDIADLGGGGGGYVEVTGTLSAGNTTLTLSDAAITANATYDYYTTVFGVNPIAVVISTGSMVLTFEAQQTNIGVKVRIS